AVRGLCCERRGLAKASPEQCAQVSNKSGRDETMHTKTLCEENAMKSCRPLFLILPFCSSVPSRFLLTSFCVVVLLITYHSSLITASAQSATATLSGTVEDQNGASIPGVEITVINPATALERQVTTNDAGYFNVPLLPPGKYVVMAKRQGFK